MPRDGSTGWTGDISRWKLTGQSPVTIADSRGPLNLTRGECNGSSGSPVDSKAGAEVDVPSGVLSYFLIIAALARSLGTVGVPLDRFR